MSGKPYQGWRMDLVVSPALALNQTGIIVQKGHSRKQLTLFVLTCGGEKEAQVVLLEGKEWGGRASQSDTWR